MNKYVLSSLVMLFLNLSVYAQSQGSKSNRGNQKEAMNSLVAALELDGLQESEFKNVIQQSMKQRRSLREQDLAQNEKRESLQTISLTENEEVSKVLNEDQYKEFLLLKKEMREKAMKQRNGGGKKRN